jgi:XTP/dITP diphosphohydrolase
MKLVFATHNQNKFKEVASLMPASVELLSLADIGCNEEIAETAKTIEGNAALKANYVRDRYGYDCFADDTGLEVTSLNDEPGVYSARYAGPNNDASANMAKLLKNLNGHLNRKARFKTAIALTLNGSETLFLGICAGTIIKEPRGNKGFGYDPVFQPEGYKTTFAEMSLEEKSAIGHRGKAIRQLIDYLSES